MSTDPTTVSTLSQDLKFAITANTILVPEIIAQLEPALHWLPFSTAEKIKAESAIILKCIQPPKKLQTLKSVKHNKNLVLVSADKGNAAVVLNAITFSNFDFLPPKFQFLPKNFVWSHNQIWTPN